VERGIGRERKTERGREVVDVRDTPHPPPASYAPFVCRARALARRHTLLHTLHTPTHSTLPTPTAGFFRSRVCRLVPWLVAGAAAGAARGCGRGLGFRGAG
jgi:hypothetical protein